MTNSKQLQAHSISQDSNECNKLWCVYLHRLTSINQNSQQTLDKASIHRQLHKYCDSDTYITHTLEHEQIKQIKQIKHTIIQSANKLSDELTERISQHFSAEAALFVYLSYCCAALIVTWITLLPFYSKCTSVTGSGINRYLHCVEAWSLHVLIQPWALA